jgi:hypothetical protein
MAKVTGPLLSFGAGGQLAKTQVYSSWKGIPYVRRYVVPATGQAPNQIAVRNAFKWLNQVWKYGDTDMQNPWSANAQGRPVTNRNVFLQKNVASLYPLDDVSLFVGSPGAKGGVGFPSISATGGSGEIDVTFGALTPPPSLQIGYSVALAVEDVDPQTATTYYTQTEQGTSSPWSITMSDVPAGDYFVCGWPVFTADGTPGGDVVAFGPSVITGTSVTVT